MHTAVTDPSGLPLPTMQLKLLGGFAVHIDGGELPLERWPSLRAAQLVQLLGLQPHHQLTREQVIDALWPQLDPGAGSANLRKATHHARQALGRHDAVMVHGGAVLLWPQRPVRVDAEDFEHAAGAALARRDAAECAEAASTYGGALLPGSLYEGWTVAARERLHARHLELLRVAGQWEQLVRLEPTDEPAHRALMQRDLQAGNRAAALRWYARLREALQESLGVAPDRQTDALYERCVAGLQSSGPAFVGRALQIAQALAWLGVAPAERTGGIVLRGPGGIGKSALGHEIAEQARERGWRVQPVQAGGPGRAYALVTAIAERLLLDDHAALDRVGDAARNVLGRLTPLAAPSRPLPGPLGRHQVLGAIRRLLVASAGGDELLLQVDDVHLAGDADADVLMQLAMGGAPVCLLLGLRPTASDSVLARGIARLHAAGVLQLLERGPLDDDECRRLVQRAASAPLDAEVAARVAAAAQGNPFAAIELARCAGTLSTS
jgi:DNA-binding SARP family transcriptional activator